MKIIREILLGWNEDGSQLHIKVIMDNGKIRYRTDVLGHHLRGKLQKQKPYVARPNPMLKEVNK